MELRARLGEDESPETEGLLETETERVSMINMFSNVFAKVINLPTLGVLSPEEALLAWLVSECKSEYFQELTTLVMQVPVCINSPESSAVANVLEIVKQTHTGSGYDNFGRLLCSLSFISCYLEMVLQSSERYLHLFASELAEFYLGHSRLWLRSRNTLYEKLREDFPASYAYFFLKQKWLKLITFSKK
ncbi:apoptosis regulator BALF1 [Equid gammaherpesvirus 5]|uniref:Apoptosis regulator BALF1 n=1 Tax=Equid gammaherpesvirus 5 TaxID=10371 RepID=A0A0B4Q5G9_9GAMA|nr:apoptosis regulator BALF1 [Equid gammaherpesvirus 5]AIU39532.1 apoptosis regulator BALF1 [Equid gammaherpesvirus 5]UTK45436.1 apoptosis regulator BALF1 [Equid gammaherpesvirus 5]UTK45515.1 apoptosis regulator BALF1 [Equid gammaherpesvirus 5]UTK45594.1 apoptosis regulator BALF1 [Equid gammaherpesvirus 5]UTK45673.1 apoptosis regulator BALF1 [Equid gammaherpesvirus 5]